MNRKLTATCALFGMLAAPAIASAATVTTAYTNASVNLRTRPDAGYPRVTTLPAGTALQVHGCISDWSWCDVGAGRERGWVSAGLIDHVENNRHVTLSLNGQRLGLQVLGFTFGTYWDTHYRNRSWYGQRQQWANYQPPSRSGTASHAVKPVTAKPAQAAKKPTAAAGRQSTSQPVASKPASTQSQASHNGGHADETKKASGKAQQQNGSQHGRAEEKRPR